MESCSTSGIGQKQVVNVCDGACLGYVTDIELDVCEGRITALLVGQGGIRRGDCVRVPWCDIKCIGEDVILVDLPPSACPCPPPCEEKKKKRKIF